MKKGQTKEYKTTLLDEYIEMLIQDKNKDLSQLFRLYCEKSLALENVLLMDTLVHMKRKSTSIPIEALKEIQEQFLAPFSTYEVNVPMKVKRSIIDAMDDASKKNLQKVNTEILNEIMVETEYNLRSTFMRFQKTNEFMQWEEIYQLQKDQSALT
ncbi:hypothetical protein C9374_001882 [Naegleria lovaniensis]|uniref:RGS domain-containing protein n=1 Tax=Naegleria lovaniensis TaxID=51637 RepID=A0AA88KQX3_NAELO|nr:uncharacterized protein C9374_001882 [Naegleria lovaniensis]KAG2386847.1 hypothetical protein C9374_001882 [Naegleria lovaniensis]